MGCPCESPTREDLDGDGERGLDCLTFALVSSKAHREGCKDSCGGFLYWQEFQKLFFSYECEGYHSCAALWFVSQFLSFYPIPSEYDVIFPTSTQTIFDTPPGYVGLLNPFGCAKLTTFIIMCKAYGCEPSVDLFRDFIISSKYPQLLLDENRLNSKSFKDKLPPNIDENPYFQHFGRYPTRVRVFDDPILFLAGLKPSWVFGQQRLAIIMGDKEMAFRNFIYTEDNDDLAFLPKESSSGFGTGSPSASVNTELPKGVEEPEV
ncbi:hypothetical protein Tco_0217928 [Tanacetum coccineum]